MRKLSETNYAYGNININKSQLESNWIDRIVRQVRFVNENFSGFHLHLEIRRFCNCWPNYLHKEAGIT